MTEMAQNFTKETCMPNGRILLSVDLLGPYWGNALTMLGPYWDHVLAVLVSYLAISTISLLFDA